MCGQQVLLPDGPPLSQEEKIAFRKEWDARVDAGRAGDSAEVGEVRE